MDTNKIDLSGLKNAEVVQMHNILNPDNAVAKFKNAEAGCDRVNEVIAEQNKGKNKALFATRVSGLHISLLLLLAPQVMVAKDLTTRLFPAQLQVLAKMKEMGAGEAHIEKEAFHSAFGISAADPKLSDVLNLLYKHNFLIWEQDDTMMISEAANNFLEANPDHVDTKTLFAELAHEKAKAKKERPEGSTARPRTPENFLITPLIEENPCNPAKRRHSMYAKWIGNNGSDRITIKQYKDDDGILFDLTDAVKLGYAVFQDPSEKEAAMPPAKVKAVKVKVEKPAKEEAPKPAAKKAAKVK